MNKIDLHIHTTCSDGRFTPTEIINLCVSKGLAGIAITDHDNFDGFQEAVEAAKSTSLSVISGMEVTSLFNQREIHLLAYGFDVNHEYMKKISSRQRKVREKRAEKMVTQLTGLGIDITINQVKDIAGSAVISRPHIATALKKNGVVRSHNEAFYKYLADDKPGFIKTDQIDFNLVINAVRAAGGITSLAHPGNFYSDEELLMLVDAGMDGIEVIHPIHTYALQRKYERFADQYGLVKTGGSDFHGKTKLEQFRLGTVAINPAWIKSLLN